MAPGDALSSCCKLVLLGPKEASLPFINSMLCYIMLPYRRSIGSTFWQLHIATDHANLWWMEPTKLCSKFIQVQQGHPSHLKGWSTNLSHQFKIIGRSFCVYHGSLHTFLNQNPSATVEPPLAVRSAEAFCRYIWLAKNHVHAIVSNLSTLYVPLWVMTIGWTF